MSVRDPDASKRIAERLFRMPPGFADLCRKWRVKEAAVFGSALRDDFRPNPSAERPESDIDLLVTFEPDAEWNLFDRAKMESEFETRFGRRFDIVSKLGLERSSNWIRRNSIFSTAQVVYAA